MRNFPGIWRNSKLFLKILRFTKFWQNNFEFCKIQENFCKTRNKIFCESMKTKNSQRPYFYTICHLLLNFPSRLLEDSSMWHSNATLRWRRIRNRTFRFCHLLILWFKHNCTNYSTENNMLWVKLLQNNSLVSFQQPIEEGFI